MAQLHPITGRRVAIWFIAFFGVVIAVNLVMARFAIGSFSGTVVDNSYVASQRYNEWLAAGRAQAALGWRVAAERQNDGHLVVTVRGRDGREPSDATVDAIASHPLGRGANRRLAFTFVDGRFVSDAPLPDGRWQLRIEVRQGTARYRMTQALP
ncbi:MAG: FixH family protein [Sphingopyxis sp.]